jgi:hypothetical protein
MWTKRAHISCIFVIAQNVEKKFLHKECRENIYKHFCFLNFQKIQICEFLLGFSETCRKNSAITPNGLIVEYGDFSGIIVKSYLVYIYIKNVCLSVLYAFWHRMYELVEPNFLRTILSLRRRSTTTFYRKNLRPPPAKDPSVYLTNQIAAFSSIGKII